MQELQMEQLLNTEESFIITAHNACLFFTLKGPYSKKYKADYAGNKKNHCSRNYYHILNSIIY